MSEETPTENAPTPTPTPEKAAPEGQTVPYERFAKKIEQVKTLEAQLAEAQAAIETAGSWETKHHELNTTIESERATWSQKSALYEAGISDPDLAELAQWRFEKSGAENFKEWLTTAGQEDGILKTHLNKPTHPAANIPPSPNTGTKTAPPPRGEFTPESVQKMTIDELKANYGKIAGAWGYTARNFK